MHPADHISIAGPYVLLPSKSSGARYQRVTTYLEETGGGHGRFTIALARTKKMRLDSLRQVLRLAARATGFTDATRETKVAHREITVRVDEEIRWFEVAMQN